MISIFELLGLSIVIPLIFEITSVDHNQFILKNIILYISSLGLIISEDIIYNLSLMVLIFYLIKFLVLLISNFFSSYLTSLFKTEMSVFLLNEYINNSEKYLFDNKGNLLRNLSTEITIFTGSVINPLISITSEIFIILFFGFFLIALDINIFINTFVILVILSFFFYFSLKSTTTLISKKRLYHEGIRLNYALNIINMLNISKIFNFISKLSPQYYQSAKKTFYYESIQSFFSNIPKIWLEFCVILLLCIFLLFFSNDHNLEYYKGVIIIYLAFSLKLLPSVVKILRSIQNYKYGITSSDFLIKLLNNSLKNKQQSYSQNKKYLFKNLSISKLWFSYNNSEKLIENLSLNINSNEKIIGLKGKSGKGKTTLINLILKNLSYQKGSIKFNGRKKYDEMLTSGMIAYVPQNNFIFDGTIFENITLEKKFKKNDLNRLNKLLKLLELDITFNKENSIKSIKPSGGQAQRIGIARALFLDPSFIILDEATSGLNLELEKRILKNIINSIPNLTILIISHRRDTLALCKRVIEI